MFYLLKAFSFKCEIQLISPPLALRATRDLGISRGLIHNQVCRAWKRRQMSKWNRSYAVRADKMHMSHKCSQGILNFLFSRSFLRRRVPSLRKLLNNNNNNKTHISERTSKQCYEWMEIFMTTKTDLKESVSSCRPPL